MSSAIAADGSLSLIPEVSGYTGYASSATALSSDGKWIVGNLTQGGSSQAFRWQKGVGVGLLEAPTSPINQPNTFATGISDDGQVISGYGATSGYTSAQIWNGTSLVPPPFTSPLSSRSTGATANGNTVAGWVAFSPMTGTSGFTYSNGVLTTYKVPSTMFTTFQSVSPNGRYLTGQASAGANSSSFVRDRLTNTLHTLPGGLGGLNAVAVANTGAAVGYLDVATPRPFRWDAGAVTYLPPLPGGQDAGRALGISADGGVVVGWGTNASGLQNAFIWTPAWGTQSLRSVLIAHGASIDPEVRLISANAVRVHDGVINVCGTARTTVDRAFVAKLRLSSSYAGVYGGVLVDLNGTYTAAKDERIGATTDPNGVDDLPRVHEPGGGFRYTPFSRTLKPPAVLDGVDLRNRSFWFDVDLGDPARWPNPSSLYNWFIGNAADGYEGASLVIQAGNSNGNQPMDVTNHNGLRISFYRKDNRFFAFIRNLWYAQDFEIPHAPDATRYRVRVDVQNGPLTVTFTQLNGAGTENGNQPFTQHYLIGGSTDYVGLTSASFLVQMVNKTADDQVAALPTTATVSNFGTNAVPNALMATADTPYFTTFDNPYPVLYRLWAANLTMPIMGYQAALRLDQPAGNLMSFFDGRYENTALFEATPRPSFPPDGNGEFWHSQQTNSVAKATQLDTLLESYAFAVDSSATYAGPFVLSPLAESAANQPSRYYDTTGGQVVPTRLRSNAVVLDNVPPTLSNLVVKVRGKVAGSIKAGQTVRVSVNAADLGSGLNGTPTLHVGFNGPGAPAALPPIPMGSSNPGHGIYTATFTVPGGGMAASIGVSVGDNAGNYAVPLIQILAVSG